MVFSKIQERLLKNQIAKAEKVSKVKAARLKKQAMILKAKEQETQKLEALKKKLNRAKQVKGLTPSEKMALQRRKVVVDKRIAAAKKFGGEVAGRANTLLKALSDANDRMAAASERDRKAAMAKQRKSSPKKKTTKKRVTKKKATRKRR